ncbi:acyltransferase [Serratia proteamaculans]|uniref:Acyltransferase n=1 Tax=Serratia proteamaculans TaxID=28151 RepID=A0ABS0U036_SERPR|nr:acyltransferase [Serratia proteamaculans]MBI6182900.1 acyltransferase [Serratia proteamaculans]
MQKNNIDQIQWLRGIAAISVVFTHLTAKAFSVGMTEFSFTRGSIGVDIFFIISGFIMMYVCDRKEYNFASFLKNRAIRILPLHYLFLFPLVIVYLLKPSIINSNSIGTFFWESFALIPVKKEGYEYLNPVVWTLCYEFLFYSIFASFLFLKNIYFISIGTITMIAFFVTFGAFYQGENEFIVGLTDSISLEFCFGILLYLLFKIDKLSVNPIIFLIIAIATYFLLYKFSLPRFIKDGIPSVFLFVSLVNIDNLKLKWLEILGDISYEVYLCHIIVLSGTYVLLSKIGLHNLTVYYVIAFSSIVILGFLMKKLFSDKVNVLLRKMTHTKIKVKSM